MDSLEEYIKRTCMSDWEGCSCGEPKQHEGLHHCAAPTCDCTWTDEQSEIWWVEFEGEMDKIREELTGDVE